MLQNPEVEKYFEPLSAHSDVAEELFKALEPLGEYEIRGGPIECAAPYVVTKDIVFCGAAGMSETYWRLRPKDIVIALATGGQKTDLGGEWVKIILFQSDWPIPDLKHWALKAYDFARTGR
jgi:hypothetical protein